VGANLYGSRSRHGSANGHLNVTQAIKACGTGDQGRANCFLHLVHRPRPTRLKDFPYVGKYHYSLRFSTRGHRRAFERPALANAAIEQIQRTCAIESFLVIAYCVMPDHVHVIVRGTSETSDLRRCVKLTKQRIEYVARSQFTIRHLWQKGYYERVLRSRHALETAVRYVLENPVRAGLAKRVGEYPFCGPDHL
jgi:putative transposase